MNECMQCGHEFPAYTLSENARDYHTNINSLSTSNAVSHCLCIHPQLLLPQNQYIYTVAIARNLRHASIHRITFRSQGKGIQ